ncbi:MAG TPA: hypothetical protein VI999_05980 [Thermoplasmata archaeon]|nr:hypothetical protein [Thermoplasmata archaeon]
MNTNRKYITTALVVAVAVILIAGILMMPRLTTQTPPNIANPNPPSNPPGNGGNNTNGNGTTQNPPPGTGTTASAPGWQAGDWWRYDVSVANIWGDRDSILLQGWLLKTVKGTESNAAGTVYNVTVTASYALAGAFCDRESERTPFRYADVTGYVLSRTSDLALVGSFYALTMNATYTYDNRTTHVSYTAKVWTSFSPPLVVWSFPLAGKETWNATSNVSVHTWSQVRFSSRNHTYVDNRSVDFSALVSLVMHSGTPANVTVLAGTLGSIPVEISTPRRMELSDRLANQVLNVTRDFDELPGHPIARLWYSGQVGNVVKAMAWLGPYSDGKLEAELVAYNYG